MDRTILVDKDIKAGRDLLKSLDAKAFPVDAALWFFDSDVKKWKFIIASPKYDKEGPLRVYEDIQKYITSRIGKDIALTDIAATSPNNKLISLLKKVVTTPRNAINAISFTDNVIDNTFIEGVYIYRLAA